MIVISHILSQQLQLKWNTGLMSVENCRQRLLCSFNQAESPNWVFSAVLTSFPSLINAKRMFCNGNNVTPSVDWAMQSMWSDKDERNVGRNGSWRWAIGQNDCTLLYRQVLSYIWVLGPQTSVNVYLECLSLVLWHRYLIARLWHVLVDWPVCRLPMLHRHASPVPVLISGIKHMHHLVAWLWYVFMASM